MLNDVICEGLTVCRIVEESSMLSMGLIDFLIVLIDILILSDQQKGGPRYRTKQNVWGLRSIIE